jgi:hypothetical protein
VDSLNVFKSPFLAEYGRFTAGVVAVETRRGGDKWKFDINDPLPEFRFRSWNLHGLRNATPRLNFGGPLVANRLYFSQAFEYELKKLPVRDLPFPRSEKKQQSWNSFTQLDYILSSGNIMTATLHVAPQNISFAGLGFFNPQPVAPNFGVHDYQGTVGDRMGIGGGVLENTVSVSHFSAAVSPQGNGDMILTPGGNRGNYFARQNRSPSRLE